MTPEKYTQFALHTFHDLESTKFSPHEYSRLKFGSDIIAKKYGYELATEFFVAHSDAILSNRCVVISSPYNYIKNAATIMTAHFIDKLNELTVNALGRSVESTIVHRKVSYTNDYGFLSKEKRRGLIDNDEFHLNRDFIKDKLLIFIDDVRITGTHEEKLMEILQRDQIPNRAFFLYYASYNGNEPDIEGKINFAAVSTVRDYIELSREPNHHIIIRPIKYLLSQKKQVLRDLLPSIDSELLDKVYFGCLAEGYYKIPQYQRSFGLLVDERQSRSVKCESV